MIHLVKIGVRLSLRRRVTDHGINSRVCRTDNASIFIGSAAIHKSIYSSLHPHTLLAAYIAPPCWSAVNLPRMHHM